MAPLLPSTSSPIVQEANACQHGELRTLLQSEKFSHNKTQRWRRKFVQGGIASLTKTARDPKSYLTNEQRNITALKKKFQRLEYQLGFQVDELAVDGNLSIHSDIKGCLWIGFFGEDCRSPVHCY
ncbi:hypothetical protein KR51_00017640 [Rubidibacter lacunae KORDI 51-2]|uniref:Uncharacterized protein n=1 Tax=Rubidibacter lacunae KORDI 51-2 TaxID=582515 RepID=U5DIQ0_9CHRO|nr:hypothetical protein KR51_00017640 [Rubidibacter lacunae KORDI 51-2]